LEPVILVIKKVQQCKDDAEWINNEKTWNETDGRHGGLMLNRIRKLLICPKKIHSPEHTSSACFYWLRQIRRIRHSLDNESAQTLVHAFVSSRVDGCNAMLAGLSKASTDRLQRVLNAAAWVVSGTHKFDRGLTHLLHSELHWLDVPQRIQFKLEVTVHRYLRGNAPQYLINCCKSTTDAVSRQRLRSASCHQLIMP